MSVPADWRDDKAATPQWSEMLLQLEKGSGSDMFFTLTDVMEV